ncbi:MAG TPA: nucleoside-diphosphate sugar epimerase/dehydratase [Acidimicrobiales bacterium]|nr:nucleoside-diphosphate sugar epimerase/dehydratase [Acidimicrobiales bacterium]
MAASRVRSRMLFLVLDALVLAVCYSLAEVVYFRNREPAHYAGRFAAFLLLALVVQLTANQVFGLYGRMWRHAGIEEARQILLASAASLAALIALYPLGRVTHSFEAPVGVIVVGAVFCAMVMGVLRFHSRLFAWQRGSRRLGLRVAVIGSRDAGAAVVRDMLRNPKAGLMPVAVFDDDAGAHGLSLLGVPVVGGIDDIENAAPRFDIQQVVLAIPSPPAELVERALRASEAAGVAMKIVPGVREMAGTAGNAPPMARVRSPHIEDLLGRTQVATDLDAVRRSIAGRRVLITGAGGSIGTEIARQVAGFEPSLLVLLDHDETHLYDTAAVVPGPVEQVLLDIGDRKAVFEAMRQYRPEVIFHAAAHKHVPLLESHPLAAVSTNVFGTLNVVEAAAACGTGRFVFISTDKAVRPRSVMGASKWTAEQVVLSRAPENAPYCAVRFGNVLGSRGSVIPTFARQIAKGGPVTVTDPRMTRFFMSVEEAVQLVLQASVLSKGGEIFMLEMGKPVSILELAERMIRLSGYAVGTDIAIEITGARPGEKIDEDLTASGEELLSTTHEAVYRLLPSALAPEDLDMALLELDEYVATRNPELGRKALFALAESAVFSEAVVDEVAV